MKKILVVDDDPLNRQAITEMLDTRGYLTWDAADGKDALIALVNVEPHVIVSDIQMPNMNGLRLAKLVRIPVILMSGDDSLKDVALAAGARVFLAKPFRMKELIAAIESI